MVSTKEFLKRFEKAKKKKTSWEDLYEEALDYTAPNRQVFDQFGEGKDRNSINIVFDSTAQRAMSAFVSNLQSSLTPPKRKWMQLKAGALTPQNERESVDAALEFITETIFEFIKISNFDTEIASSYADLSLGVGALLVNKGTVENPLVFKSVSIAELYINEGPLGKVEEVFRNWNIELRNIEETWPGAKLSPDHKKDLVESPDKRIKVIEGIVPEKIKVQGPDGETEQMGWRYQVIDEKSKFKILDRVEKSLPWVVFRWEKLPNEIWSRGPVIQALADIKSLNYAKELMLRHASLAIAPPMMYNDAGVVNPENIEWGPGKWIAVESTGGTRGASIAPMVAPNADLQLGQFVFQDLQEAINEMMFAKPLGSVDLPVKTATEVTIRQQELARRIGSSFGRLQFELLIPLLNRIIFILDEFGAFQDAEGNPIDLSQFRIDGVDLTVEYVSPLAQAEEQEEIQNIVNYTQTMMGLYGQQVGMAFAKPDEVSSELAKRFNVPTNITPTELEVNQMKQARITPSLFECN